MRAVWPQERPMSVRISAHDWAGDDNVTPKDAVEMAREGELIAKNPLLIQKTLADKLSDKVQVIIAPPPADGGFIGSALLGASK